LNKFFTKESYQFETNFLLNCLAWNADQFFQLFIFWNDRTSKTSFMSVVLIRLKNFPISCPNRSFRCWYLFSWIWEFYRGLSAMPIVMVLQDKTKRKLWKFFLYQRFVKYIEFLQLAHRSMSYQYFIPINKRLNII
jgi:hypothetical protein